MTGVLATHVHPDHGLCRRVRETSDAWIALHPADAALLDPSDQAAETVAALPTDLGLPAHEWRFHGLRDRVRQLQDHHEARLGDVLDAVADGAATPHEVAAAMAWDHPWDQLPVLPRQIAVGEDCAHLLLLHRHGTVERMPVAPGPLAPSGSLTSGTQRPLFRPSVDKRTDSL